MPISNDSPGRTSYHSGTFRHSYVIPDIYHDPYWISRWKFDDISTGYAIDSKHTNNLRASGSPTQVAGNRLSSGVQFDGVDDCFYLPWASGSGLVGLRIIPEEEGKASFGTFNPHFGFMCSMKVTDFSKDQFIISKWNEVGNDREWGVGINPSGGIFVQFRRSAGTMFVTNSSRSGIVPSGQWCDFAFLWQGVGSNNTSTGENFSVIIDDKILTEAYGDSPNDAGASGMFVVGAANWGKSPSGFFGGVMEDLRFYNGKCPSFPNYLAFRSGVAPLSSYPNINDFNPYIGTHIQMDTMPTGDTDIATGVYYLQDRKHNVTLPQSGAAWGLNRFMVASGAPDNLFSSGIAMNAASTAIFTRAARFINEGTLLPRHSFSIMYWMKPLRNSTDDPIIIGTQTNNVGGNTNGPFNTYTTNSVLPGISLGYEQDDRDNLDVGSANPISTGVWSHVAYVVDMEQSRVDIYVSGIWKTTKAISNSGLWFDDGNKDSTQGNFRIGWADTSASILGYSGVLDEIILFHYAIPSGQIVSFYTQNSGFLYPGGYPSANIGGYTYGINTATADAYIGGYHIVGPTASGSLGGYVSGVPFYTSGMLGGYHIVGPTASGNIGGYHVGKSDQQSYIGGYAAMSSEQKFYLGGIHYGGESVDSESAFVAFFNVIGRDKHDFDAQLKINKSLNSEFDSQVVVYTDERKPDVLIFNPAIHQSGNTTPVTYTFEAHASGTQNKGIYRTYWFFSDTTSTSGSIITSSGTYKTTHTFAQSGQFDVIFIAIDENGLINSDRRIINTASGVTLPQITLSATPETGIVPMSVAFSGVINSAPYQIVDKYIYFGDGTRSASTSSIYKIYSVIGCYIPVFRVRDAFGYIVTDSTVVGVNN